MKRLILSNLKFYKIKKNLKPISVILFSSFIASGYLIHNRLNETNTVFERFLRTFCIGILNSFDYKWYLLGIDEKSPIYKETIDQCHSRCARRILHGCLTNGGLYIKLGQGLVTLNHILPSQYISTLEQLHDKASPKSYDKVKRVFLEDFGKEPDELFSQFNEQPMAAASLAQVHEATLINGDRVAVKVQYYDLQSRFYADIRTIEVMLHLVEIIHPSFGFSWVLQDMKETLSRELDFKLEADNSKRCAKDLGHLADIYVPMVYDDLSTKRILTAEYIDGIKINETGKLKEANVSLHWLDRTLVQAFSHQIFHTGFLHADPHPGNVLVRKGPNNRHQLVILDHGLYECMSETNRIQLCGLVKSLIRRDDRNIQLFSQAFGVSDWETLGEIILQHPLDMKSFGNKFKMLSAKLSDSDIQYLKRKSSDHFDKIMAVLRNIPKPMLLFVRNLNTVRSICRLHGDPINRYYYMTDSAIRASHLRYRHSNFLLSKIYLYMELEAFKWKITMSKLEAFVSRFIMNVLNILGFGPSMDSIEEILGHPEFR